ncbi:XRE family transcriptional regulator [Marinicauda algicola]|uniref:XRE family transcriptional regulator n=1 Tax=Marinicauda algicola TaxID=2029849 RepID=A0A4S2H479_9PROT|nr:helix-turn-helix transcriptional regulator [Marinicauda algicola]TGY90208.1 XRE family transcriptional regulator [Marinicauda algicola]
MDWGVELRKFRAAVGMKQDVAASHIGVSQAYVSRLESGAARPSADLAERIRKLLETPQHRPHFEHWVATVLHSPHHIMLSSLEEDGVRMVAVSPAVPASGEPFDRYRPGHKIGGELGEEASLEIARMIELGAFTGDVSCLEGYWFTPGTDGRRYWRTVNVPVRDQIGNWYLHSTTVENSEPAHRQRLETQGDTLMVWLFNRTRPVPARTLLDDASPFAGTR